MDKNSNQNQTLTATEVAQRDSLCIRYPILKSYIIHCYAVGEVEDLMSFLDGIETEDAPTQQ